MQWAAQGKKQPPPRQLSLSGKKEQGLLSLLPLLSPGLQLLVGLERLRYLGGGGAGEGEREDASSQIWDPSSSSKLGGGRVGKKQFAKEIFNAAGRSFGSLECAVCTLKKKICAGCKNADVCRGPAEI